MIFSRPKCCLRGTAVQAAGVALVLLSLAPLHAQKIARIEKIDSQTLAGVARVTIDVNGTIDIKSERIENPARIFVDFQNTVPGTMLKSDGTLSRIPQTLKLNGPFVRQIRVAENQRGLTRVVLDLANPDVEYRTSVAGDRLTIELKSIALRSSAANPLRAPVAGPVAGPVAAGPSGVLVTPPVNLNPVTIPASAKTVPPRYLPDPPTRPRSSVLADPPLLSNSTYRLPKAEASAMPYRVGGYVLRDFRAIKPPSTPVGRQAAQSMAPATAAIRASNGNRSLTRVLGLKIGRVVIDPGHGGHDPGTASHNGLTEKELVLDVAKRLGDLIDERLGSEVIYTRSDDRYIPLEERTAIANRARADLFISIHANSSPATSGGGVETYYLNFTSSPEALEVAARENAVSERSVSDLGDLIRKIALKDKIDESREFAGKVQASLHAASAKAGNRVKDRGVRKAPLVVLIGASMPCILTEIGFLSNAKEEALLKKSDYRQKIAEALYRGISQYASTLSHFNVARSSFEDENN